jgi:hypothetical protein
MRSLVVLPLVLLAGCPPVRPSHEVRQDEVIQLYEVVYEADETTASAVFKYLSSHLKLSKPSFVTHNGTVLKYHKHPRDYRRTVDGFLELHEWVWTDTERRTFANSIMLEPIAFVDPPARLSVSASTGLTFEPALGLTWYDYESVTLVRVGDSDELALTAEPGATVVEPWGYLLNDYVGGTVELQLIRRRGRKLEQGTRGGGCIAAEYRSEPIVVAVDP